MRLNCTLLIGLFSCSDKGADDESSKGSIEGTVNVVDQEHSASIYWDTAVAYATDDTLIAYFTGAPGASCASIAEYLGPNEGAVRKDKVLQGDSCTLMIKIEKWDGTSSWSPSSDGIHPGYSSNLRCDFGDGSWVLETRGEEYEDYYWDGDYFTGIPEAFSWDIRELEFPAGLDVQVSFTEFEGNFPYVVSSDRYTVEADVSGRITASWCDELANASVLRKP